MTLSYSYVISFYLELTLPRPLSALLSQISFPHCQGSWLAAGWLVNACLKQVLWQQLLWRLVSLRCPWWGPQQGLVKAEDGAGKDWEQEAEVWGLKQGERLMARVWLHWVGRLH